MEGCFYKPLICTWTLWKYIRLGSVLNLLGLRTPPAIHKRHLQGIRETYSNQRDSNNKRICSLWTKTTQTTLLLILQYFNTAFADFFHRSSDASVSHHYSFCGSVPRIKRLFRNRIGLLRRCPPNSKCLRKARKWLGKVYFVQFVSPHCFPLLFIFVLYSIAQEFPIYLLSPSPFYRLTLSSCLFNLFISFHHLL